MSLNSRRILIVDDEKDLVDLLASEFGENDFTVFTAHCGEEASRVLETTSVDIVLTDVRMPNSGGADLIHYIHSKGLDVKIYLMTAYNDISIQEQKSLGVNSVFRKPFSMTDLVNRVGSD